jgi:hypothetical protein
MVPIRVTWLAATHSLVGNAYAFLVHVWKSFVAIAAPQIDVTKPASQSIYIISDSRRLTRTTDDKNDKSN